MFFVFVKNWDRARRRIRRSTHVVDDHASALVIDGIYRLVHAVIFIAIKVFGLVCIQISFIFSIIQPIKQQQHYSADTETYLAPVTRKVKEEAKQMIKIANSVSMYRKPNYHGYLDLCIPARSKKKKKKLTCHLVVHHEPATAWPR